MPVDRQGEFFFLPVQLDSIGINPFLVGDKIDRIQIGNSRPNYVEEGFKHDGAFFVRGNIRHSGREHADLNLGKSLDFWFKVVPNTSKANFQLTGDID
jgi:hypothetical protein